MARDGTGRPQRNTTTNDSSHRGACGFTLSGNESSGIHEPRRGYSTALRFHKLQVPHFRLYTLRHGGTFQQSGAHVKCFSPVGSSDRTGGSGPWFRIRAAYLSGVDARRSTEHVSPQVRVHARGASDFDEPYFYRKRRMPSPTRCRESRTE